MFHVVQYLLHWIALRLKLIWVNYLRYLEQHLAHRKCYHIVLMLLLQKSCWIFIDKYFKLYLEYVFKKSCDFTSRFYIIIIWTIWVWLHDPKMLQNVLQYFFLSRGLKWDIILIVINLPWMIHTLLWSSWGAITQIDIFEFGLCL